jgi:endoglucanase
VAAGAVTALVNATVTAAPLASTSTAVPSAHRLAGSPRAEPRPQHPLGSLQGMHLLSTPVAPGRSLGTSTSGTATTSSTGAGAEHPAPDQAPTTSSGNLLTGDAATFSGSSGAWTGIDSTLSWVVAPSTTGHGSLQMTATTTSWVQAWSPFPPVGSGTPAAAGQKFAGRASVYESGGPEPMSAGLTFLSPSDAIVGSVLGQVVTPVTGTWVQLPEVAAVAPSSAAWVVVGVVEYGASVGQVTDIESPVLSALGPGSPAVVGPLHTSGNQVVQADGKPVVLQGVVLEGLENSGTLADTDVSQDAVRQAKVWGANFVRVPLGEQFWLSSNCDYVPSYQYSVDQVVKWITSLGMVALLDLHTNTVNGCEPGTEHNMADEAQSPEFWSQVAGRYGDPSSPEYNPLVAFDLYNEPHDISDTTWLLGGPTTDYYGGQTYVAAGMQQLYDSVRAAGSQNLVFISGNNWANTPPSVLVTGTNIVYAVHYYTCTESPPPSCSNANPYDPSQDLDLWLALSASQPVAVTEFGWPGQGDGTYMANVVAYAQDHGWGWSAFAWMEQPNTFGFIFEKWLPDGTAEPAPSGVAILLGLSRPG